MGGPHGAPPIGRKRPVCASDPPWDEMRLPSMPLGLDGKESEVQLESVSRHSAPMPTMMRMTMMVWSMGCLPVKVADRGAAL